MLKTRWYVKLLAGFKRLMNLEFSRQILEKYIKFYQNACSGSRVVCNAGGRTDMAKLTLAFFPRNFCERA